MVLLIAYQLNYSERLGLPAYLEATHAGKPLYERFGYKSVRDILLNTKLSDTKAILEYRVTVSFLIDVISCHGL